ncbi:MAG: Hsp33 family molecular chaperone HslO [Pseudomonadales bacterium]
MQDAVQRFTLERTGIRGEIVRLSNSVQQATALQYYPPGVRQTLNEFFAATTLLSTTIKFDGQLILQAKSTGQIPLIMAECHSSGAIRGIARGAQGASSEDFVDLLNGGTLAITIQPDKGEQYQGIVPLQGQSLAACLEYYFAQSEQLPTVFWFASTPQQVVAMMLQVLPSQQPMTEDWEQAVQLGATLSSDEMLAVDNETLLYRVFNSFGVRVHESKPIEFNCSCSSQRCLSAVHTLGESEANKLLEEQGSIQMDCEFCGQHYEFGRAEVSQLFGVGGSASVH